MFPVLFLIVAGIIQFGFIFWSQNTLTQIARDTGRWAATQQTDCTTPATTATANVVTEANIIASASSLFGYTAGSWNGSNVGVTYSGSPCPPESNQQVTFVTIELHHRIPLFFPLVPGNGNLSTAAQFRMEPEPK